MRDGEAVSRLAHNQKVGSSNLSPATKDFFKKKFIMEKLSKEEFLKLSPEEQNNYKQSLADDLEGFAELTKEEYDLLSPEDKTAYEKKVDAKRWKDAYESYLNPPVNEYTVFVNIKHYVKVQGANREEAFENLKRHDFGQYLESEKDVRWDDVTKVEV